MANTTRDLGDICRERMIIQREIEKLEQKILDVKTGKSERKLSTLRTELEKIDKEIELSD